ncbi:MAG: four helix bundle protein [Planctomycetaceae bacterium]
MKDYRELQVWRKAHDLTLAIYQTIKHFPNDERFGLVSQLRRAAGSIGSNIAEGCGRSSDPDFARCCQIAMGSACEVNYQLLLARDLGYLPDSEHDRLNGLVCEVQRMLTALLARIRS